MEKRSRPVPFAIQIEVVMEKPVLWAFYDVVTDNELDYMKTKALSQVSLIQPPIAAVYFFEKRFTRTRDSELCVHWCQLLTDIITATPYHLATSKLSFIRLPRNLGKRRHFFQPSL